MQPAREATFGFLIDKPPAHVFPKWLFKDDFFFTFVVKQTKTYFGEVGMEKAAKSLIPTRLPEH